MIDFKYVFSKLLLVSDLCFVLNLIPHCIILRYIHISTIDWVLFFQIYTSKLVYLKIFTLFVDSF